MLTIKYDIEMPNLGLNWVKEVYKKSWFYIVYKKDLNNFFLDKEQIETIKVDNLNIIFKDFVRFLSKSINKDDFKKCKFELSFIVNNEDLILTEQLGLENKSKIIYLKYTLINGEYESSYQFLENINTIKNETVKY